MLLKIESQERGLHPSETVVQVKTKGGLEELIVDPGSIVNGRLDVRWPVDADGKYRLVELPRQTARGNRRVWVDIDSLTAEPERMRA